MNTADPKTEAKPEVQANESPTAPMSRRTLLSGARAAVPVIVTLYSGAALAQTSANLISADSTPGPEGGKFRCLNTQGLDRPKPNTYDLGKQPLAHVTRIDSQKSYYKPGYNGPSSQKVSGQTMCNSGGDFYRKDSSNRYKKVNVKRGVLVSATAIGSFSNGVTYTDV